MHDENGASSADYSIEYTDSGSYLRASVSGGHDSMAISLAYWREIADAARRRGAQRVLVVENFQTQVPLLDVFQVAEQIPLIIEGLTVAFVDERFEHFEENRFAEDVAVNRGAVGKVFATEEAAILWLTG
jgi:hypothetical protein